MVRELQSENREVNRDSQRRRVYDYLKAREGQWVSLSELMDLRIAQLNTRLWELRHLEGREIENKTWRDERGQVRSSYRLRSKLVQRQLLEPPPREPQGHYLENRRMAL